MSSSFKRIIIIFTGARQGVLLYNQVYYYSAPVRIRRNTFITRCDDNGPARPGGGGDTFPRVIYYTNKYTRAYAIILLPYAGVPPPPGWSVEVGRGGRGAAAEERKCVLPGLPGPSLTRRENAGTRCGFSPHPV